MRGMVELLYLSVATREMSPADLDEIRSAAMRANPKRNVTGALMYGQRTFMQILEGEEADVEFILARIRSDPRHTSVNFFYEGPILERSFSDWAMAVGEGKVPELKLRQPDYPATAKPERNVAVDLFLSMCGDLRPST